MSFKNYSQERTLNKANETSNTGFVEEATL